MTPSAKQSLVDMAPKYILEQVCITTIFFVVFPLFITVLWIRIQKRRNLFPKEQSCGSGSACGYGSIMLSEYGNRSDPDPIRIQGFDKKQKIYS
jgi:hypothetical protein